MKPMLIGCLLLAGISTTPLALAGSTRTVQVSASAEVKASPDYVLLNLQLSDQQPSLQQAKNTIDRAFEQLLSIRDVLGIADTDVRAEQIRNHPMYQWKDGERRYTGEQVSRSVQITLRNMDNYSPLIDQIMQLPTVQVQNSSFMFNDPDALQHQALKRALVKAKTKAKLMAETMGAELGEVQTMSENGGQVAMPMMLKSSMARAEAAPSSNMQVQSQTVSASVSVSFELD